MISLYFQLLSLKAATSTESSSENVNIQKYYKYDGNVATQKNTSEYTTIFSFEETDNDLYNIASYCTIDHSIILPCECNVILYRKIRNQAGPGEKICALESFRDARNIIRVDPLRATDEDIRNKRRELFKEYADDILSWWLVDSEGNEIISRYFKFDNKEKKFYFIHNESEIFCEKWKKILNDIKQKQILLKVI